jgi:hypothetical protein
MTGEIIYLKAHCALKRGQLYRDQSVPRRAPAVRRLNDHSQSAHRRASLAPEAKDSRIELQVARIADLLSELEDLTRAPEAISPEVLGQARAGIAKARRILKPWICGDSKADPDGDPQPQIDDERLERMYRELNPDV